MFHVLLYLCICLLYLNGNRKQFILILPNLFQDEKSAFSQAFFILSTSSILILTTNQFACVGCHCYRNVLWFNFIESVREGLHCTGAPVYICTVGGQNLALCHLSVHWHCYWAPSSQPLIGQCGLTQISDWSSAWLTLEWGPTTAHSTTAYSQYNISGASFISTAVSHWVSGKSVNISEVTWGWGWRKYSGSSDFPRAFPWLLTCGHCAIPMNSLHPMLLIFWT